MAKTFDIGIDDSGPIEAREILGLVDIEKFGPYDVLAKIAGGGMAEIYRVHHEDDPSTLYALKRIRSDRTGDEDFNRMLMDEARIAAHLEHPNIARVIGLEHHNGDYGLILEYVDGVDLLQAQKVLRQRDALIPLQAAVHVLHRTLLGLDFAHNVKDEEGESLNIVHRDVSPGNIMITRDGEVKIVDWGIARAKNRFAKTEAGNIKGKFRYMPPEQITNQALGPYSDTYSAAVTFWELLAGRRLYDGSEMAHFMMKVANAEVPSLHDARSDVPDGLERIYQKATAKKPKNRFASAAEFAAALDEVPGRLPDIEARSILSTIPTDARIFEGQRVYETAVAKAREVSSGDLEGALLRALEEPDRVEREEVDWETIDDAEALRRAERAARVS